MPTTKTTPTPPTTYYFPRRHSHTPLAPFEKEPVVLPPVERPNPKIRPEGPILGLCEYLAFALPPSPGQKVCLPFNPNRDLGYLLLLALEKDKNHEVPEFQNKSRIIHETLAFIRNGSIDNLFE